MVKEYVDNKRRQHNRGRKYEKDSYEGVEKKMKDSPWVKIKQILLSQGWRERERGNLPDLLCHTSISPASVRGSSLNLKKYLCNIKEKINWKKKIK